MVSSDLGEIGDALSSLVVELKGFNKEEEKGVFGFFKKKRNELEAMKVAYSKAETNGSASDSWLSSSWTALASWAF